MSRKRFGKNTTGYFGDTIDVVTVLNDCVEAGRSHGWQIEEIGVGHHLNLIFLTRRSLPEYCPKSEDSTRRIYLSAGIHGDEPAGPLAILRLLQANAWPPEAEIWLAPCLNPAGFISNRRENPEGLDLNRQYLHPKAAETLAHIAWLEHQPSFHLCLCLHEDWEAHGYYLYELNPDNQPSLAEAILSAAAEECPIDASPIIEGRPASNGIIRPSVDPRDRPQWPEAFFLLSRKTRLSYTLEAPSDYALDVRVRALTNSVGAALQTLPDNRSNGGLSLHPRKDRR